MRRRPTTEPASARAARPPASGGAGRLTGEGGELPADEASFPSPGSGYLERGTRTFREVVLALFLAGYATFSLLYCVQPLLPELAEAFSLSPARASLALSVTTAVLAGAILVAGVASERLGRRGLMFSSLCVAAALNLYAAVAPTWHLLLLARALEGVAVAGVPAVAMAYLAEEIHPAGLGLAMGLYVGGTALGGLAGRVITGAVAELVSWRAALAVVGVLGLAAAVGFRLLLPPSRHFTPRRGDGLAFHLRAFGAHLSGRGLPWLFATGFLVMGTFVTAYNYVGFRLRAPPYLLGQTSAGLVFLVYLLGVPGSSWAGALADRLGRAPVLLAGVAMLGAGLALSLARPLPAIIAGMAVLTVGFFVSHAVASGWVGRMALRQKGHATSLYLLAYYVGSSVMGSAGGAFWARGGWPAVAGFVAVAVVAALGVALRLRVLERQERAAPHPA